MKKENEEAKVVEAEVIQDKQMALPSDQVIHLTRALPDGKDILYLDLIKLRDIPCSNVKRSKKQDASIVVPALSQVYQSHVAAVAAGIKYDDILSCRQKTLRPS